MLEAVDFLGHVIAFGSLQGRTLALSICISLTRIREILSSLCRAFRHSSFTRLRGEARCCVLSGSLVILALFCPDNRDAVGLRKQRAVLPAAAIGCSTFVPCQIPLMAGLQFAHRVWRVLRGPISRRNKLFPNIDQAFLGVLLHLW